MAHTRHFLSANKDSILSVARFIGQTLLALSIFAALYFFLITGYALGFKM